MRKPIGLAKHHTIISKQCKALLCHPSIHPCVYIVLILGKDAYLLKNICGALYTGHMWCHLQGAYVDTRRLFNIRSLGILFINKISIHFSSLKNTKLLRLNLLHNSLKSMEIYCCIKKGEV